MGSSDQDDAKRVLSGHTWIMRSFGGLAVLLLVVAVIGCSEPNTDPTGRTWELAT
jgi:hypothetical protein